MLERETIQVNKQVLIQAILELERQESFQAYILLSCMESLQDIITRFDQNLVKGGTIRARDRLLKALFPEQNRDTLVTDELLEQWETEFQELTHSAP